MDNQDYDLKPKRKSARIGFIVVFLVLLIGFAAFYSIVMMDHSENPEEIITISKLEKIIKISELNTFQAVYNGIAEVPSDDDSGKLDYYVSYEAKVNVGFDIENLEITKDDEAKKILVVLPVIEIIDVNVDIASLDYMFQDKKANTSTVSQQAYKTCIADAVLESEKTPEIFELAKQNAENIVEALIGPFIEEFDSEYELEIK